MLLDRKTEITIFVFTLRLAYIVVTFVIRWACSCQMLTFLFKYLTSICLIPYLGLFNVYLFDKAQ